MDFDVFSKLLFGIISALGSIALTFYNIEQARKLKADLLEKFDDAIAKENKHSTTELFRLIHGLRMSYGDVIQLIKQDDCSRIIYALKKTPGLVSFKNGCFQYHGVGQSKIFRHIDKWFTRVTILLFGGLFLFSLALLGFGSGATSAAGFVLLISSSIVFAVQMRQRAYDQMVEALVTKEHNKQGSLETLDS